MIHKLHFFCKQLLYYLMTDSPPPPVLHATGYNTIKQNRNLYNFIAFETFSNESSFGDSEFGVIFRSV